MEAWKGTNYLTYNTTRWVELMNMSTLELGIGYFPENVVAITEKYNETYDFPAGTLVIENAARSRVGTSGIEQIVFITTSLFSIICAGIWLCRNWSKVTSGGQQTPPPRLVPESVPISDVASMGTSGTALNSIGDSGVSAASFERKLRYFYYDSTKSHLEAWEKDTNMDSVAAEDIESGSELLRKMYGLDLEMWARQGPSQTPEALNEQQWKSDAIFTEVRQLVDGWDEVLRNSGTGASQRELEEMQEIKNALAQLPAERYDRKWPIEPETVQMPQDRRRRFPGV